MNYLIGLIVTIVAFAVGFFLGIKVGQTLALSNAPEIQLIKKYLKGDENKNGMDKKRQSESSRTTATVATSNANNRTS